jgi:hypothetical protein
VPARATSRTCARAWPLQRLAVARRNPVRATRDSIPRSPSMKNKLKTTKTLTVSGETIRKLNHGELVAVAGGGTQSNNGCTSRGMGTSFCYACQN